MRYRFVFVDAITETHILDYDTDADPPRVGEFFQPVGITKNKDMNNYRVKDVYHQPESSALTIVIITLEIEKPAKA